MIFHSWTFLMWYNMPVYFSLSNLTLPLHVAQHHQKWFMMALIHGPSSEQHFFFSAINKCFLMFLAKCQTSNWRQISFSFFLKNDLTCVCLSVVREEILMALSYNLWRTFLKLSNSILAELPSIPTWKTCISIIIQVCLSIMVSVPYLEL